MLVFRRERDGDKEIAGGVHIFQFFFIIIRPLPPHLIAFPNSFFVSPLFYHPLSHFPKTTYSITFRISDPTAAFFTAECTNNF